MPKHSFKDNSPEKRSLIAKKGSNASIETKRKQAGIHVRKLRSLFVEIIDADDFREQLRKEIFEQNKAIKFLQVVSKYNPAGETTDGSARSGNVNIMINSPVDRDVPAVEIKQITDEDE